MTSARAFALAMLNGPLDDETLLPFLDGLVQSGYQGVCFHPRDGLLVPYGSRHYWERLAHLIEQAQARGLEIWHYDEFPYPSGAFGGILPEKNPASRLQALEFSEVAPTPTDSGLIDLGPGALLALLRYRLVNGTIEETCDVTPDCGSHFDTWVWGPWHNRYYTGTYNVHEELHERASAERFTMCYLPQEPLQPDERLVAIKVVTVAGRKGGAGVPDAMLPEVTDAFLELAYRPLVEISQRCGLENTPVFQDEVAFGAPFPWNREIEARLRTIWGENLSCRLLALHSRALPGWELARYDYRRACASAIEENWFARVAAFCAQNGLQMTGHLPGEESFVGHATFMGDAFKSLRHFDIPGYDIISATLPDEHNRGQAVGAKIVQSVAWMEGRKTTMVEVFGANGFHTDLQKNRSVLAWLALHDLTHTFDHSTYSCALSVRKYDAPPVNNRFNPLDRGRADLWAWHTAFCDLLETYRFAPRTLILFPVESLARFQLNEWDEWRESASLLETWFHYALTHSFDTLFVPTHHLHEVHAVEDGFEWQGQRFENFWVPPVPSLHEDTVTLLHRLADHPGFCHIHPADGPPVVFGPSVRSEERVTLGKRVLGCTEATLMERGAAWFEQLNTTPLSCFTASRTLLKSLRRTDDGKELLILLNPHDEGMDVHCTQWPGEPLLLSADSFQTPVVVAENGFSLRLAPREVALFRRGATSPTSTSRTPAEEIQSQSALWRSTADNHVSLKVGTSHLEGETSVKFQPAPVSSLWKMALPYSEDSHAIYAPPYSKAALLRPLALTVCFDVMLESPLEHLTVVLDAESLPPYATLWWDEAALERQTRDIYEHGNTVFPIPASLLRAGKHVLKVEGVVHHGAQGVLEKPILTGSFAVRDEDTLTLAAPCTDWQAWQSGQTWGTMGLPEGFGPVEYRFAFALSQEQAQDTWALHLPPCMGVTEVEINNHSAGRMSWEPRVLPLSSHLLAGQNQLLIRVFGSWNNLFSKLNRLKNGLTARPTLRRLSAPHLQHDL